MAENELASEKGINYTKLRDLLKEQDWKAANKETANRMCEVMGRQEDGWLSVAAVENFPCTDLRTIDQLWVKHSQGQFGFSVQKKIWQECGSPSTYNTKMEKFGEAVGWKKKGFLGMNNNWKSYSDITFDTTSPKGHLPAWGLGVSMRFITSELVVGVEGGLCVVPFLASRLVDCSI
jgi:GUN4-like